MARKDGRDRGVTFKDGCWWVRVYSNGREKWYRCTNKSEAKALYGRLKAEEREGRYFEKPKSVSFRALMKDYLAALAVRRRKGDDNARATKWIEAFGDRNVATITARDIEHVLSEIRVTRKIAGDDGKAVGMKVPAQPGTIVRYLTVLKATFNRAKRLGLIKDNPASLVQPPHVNNVLVRYLTDEQQAKLMAALPERFKPIVLTAVHTGLRQGELLRLTWADVDENAGVLTINETKAGERRRVPMNSIVQSLLADLKAVEPPAPTDRVFPHDHRYLRRAFDRGVKHSRLAPFRFHDLRHTFASRLAMNGANDRTIMALGGWKSPRMLDRYAHLSPTHLWQAVEGLTRIGTGSKTGSAVHQGSGGAAEAVENNGAGNGI